MKKILTITLLFQLAFSAFAQYQTATAAKNRKAGPFIDFPENDKTINIDPRVKP
jgi:hypothetical protein